MTAKEESSFMTNREMIREMYVRTKNTEDMIGNMKGDISVLRTTQNAHADDIKGLKNWRNINVTGTGIIAAIGALIGFK